MPPKLPGTSTVAGRVRTLTALALLSLAVLVVVAELAVGDAREGLRGLGHREGPTVAASGDLYLALNDMDAQVTNVLLTGGESGWLCGAGEQDAGCERSSPSYTYSTRREDAQAAALQAARLDPADEGWQQTVQALLDGLHVYDQQVQAAMEAGARSRHGLAAPPPDAVERYRAATELMTRDLLPKAYNLTLESAADVDTAYQDKRADVRAGRLRVLGAGLAAVAALASLQVFLARRFRRLVNLPLVAATVAVLALTVAAASLLATEADHLKAAKSGGFDPVLDLTRARAVAGGMDSDRSRQLIDPASSDRYDQSYLEKSQRVLRIRGASDLAVYYRELRQWRPGFGGFYGLQLRRAAEVEPGLLLASYRGYQEHDRAVRDRAASGDRAGAARAQVDPRWSYLPAPALQAHYRDLDVRISHHEYVWGRRVAAGDRAAKPWYWLAPAGALVVAALVVAGVWPRLAEYR